MTAPNHVIGGFVFTGIISSFVDINILSSPTYIITIIIASMLPDIDHTRSLVGKLFYPLSHYISRHYGHRTITHSLAALLVVFLLSRLLELLFFDSIEFAFIFTLAYLSHLIFDMMTLQGVPLFYPFKRNACVLPANPSYRLRVNDLSQEAAVFSLFTVCSLFLTPLFAQGFWTTYNKTFSTIDHLCREYKQSDQMIYAMILSKNGTTYFQHEGLVLECDGSKAILYNTDMKGLNPTFTEVPQKYESIQEVSFDKIEGLSFSITTVPDTTASEIHPYKDAYLNIFRTND